MLLCANVFSIGLSLELWPVKSLSIRIAISRRLFRPVYHLWLAQFDILGAVASQQLYFRKATIIRSVSKAVETRILWPSTTPFFSISSTACG